VDVTRWTAVAGVAAAAIVAWLAEVHLAAVVAGIVGALAVATADRGARGLAAASLGLAVAAQVLAAALATVGGGATALATVGIAVAVAAAVHGAAGGRPRGVVAAWSAGMVVGAAVLATLVARSASFLSLLGARLATTRAGWLLVVLPLVVGAVATKVSLDRWRAADLPAVACTFGPPGVVIAVGLLVGPGLPAVDALRGGSPPPGVIVLLYAAAAALIASALAAAAAAVDCRFRRPPAWLAVSVGPAALLLLLALDAGVFVAALLAAVPGVAPAVGAVLGTGHPAFVAPFFGALVVAVVATAATAPTLSPQAREALAARSENLVLVGLLPVPLLALGDQLVVVYAGCVAVVAWLLVADRLTIPRPPRTAHRTPGVVARRDDESSHRIFR